MNSPCIKLGMWQVTLALATSVRVSALRSTRASGVEGLVLHKETSSTPSSSASAPGRATKCGSWGNDEALSFHVIIFPVCVSTFIICNKVVLCSQENDLKHGTVIQREEFSTWKSFVNAISDSIIQ